MTTIAEVAITSLAPTVPMAQFTWVSESDIPARIAMGGRLKRFAEFLKQNPMRWARLEGGNRKGSSTQSGTAAYLKTTYGLEAVARASEHGGTYHVYARFVPSNSGS